MREVYGFGLSWNRFDFFRLIFFAILWHHFNDGVIIDPNTGFVDKWAYGLSDSNIVTFAQHVKYTDSLGLLTISLSVK